ncbi:MAG: 7-cyano-7-deazaguanine synthase, partial [Endomicrobiales bacterium]
MAICKKCVLPESKPDLWLNEEGLCNVCVQHEAEKKSREEADVLETDLIKILNQYRGKSRYECLVMCSGGKDSTSALYYMKKRYKLNPLAFMFDHGFETEDAVENVRKAVDALGVDFLFFKTDFVQDLFAKILKTGSKAVICHPCSIWYMQLTFDIAARFEVPLIIAGWTKGQSTRQQVMSKCACSISAPEYQSMARATREFMETQLRADPKYRDFPMSMEEVLAAAKKRHKSLVLSPHWFLPIDQETYIETIKNELGWKVPRLSYPRNSTNCYMNFISVHNSMKHFGYTHYHIEMSKMIREGIITREQALRDLEIFFDKE